MCWLSQDDGWPKSSKDIRELYDRTFEDQRCHVSTTQDRGENISNRLIMRTSVILDPIWTIFFGFWLQNLIEALSKMEGNTWRHHKVCVRTNQSLEELVVVRCIDKGLDRFVLRLSSSAKKKWRQPQTRADFLDPQSFPWILELIFCCKSIFLHFVFLSCVFYGGHNFFKSSNKIWFFGVMSSISCGVF